MPSARTSRPVNPAEPPELPPARARAIQRRLLDWYDAHEEPFPWRTARDPYAAMVAAVAAQQTQMSRVLQIYDRWMAAFPTVAALAAADRTEVLRVWARAGYPRRAANLHEAARVCVERHGGILPRDREAILALPGVGPFTAAIIQTFGFDEDAAAVDTNIVRVLGRVVAGDLQPAKETPTATIAALAERLLPRGEAARWNPALMDYGAKVCMRRRHALRGPAALRRRRDRRAGARPGRVARLRPDVARPHHAGAPRPPGGSRAHHDDRRPHASRGARRRARPRARPAR